jgi:FkbM family methyltransferase
MSDLTSLVRKAGLMPLVKPLVERSAAAFGFKLLPAQQVGVVNWLGLRNYPVRAVLDIGACRGGFARDILAPNFPNATVHSFEPSPVAFAALSETAAAAGGRIVAHNFGLGETAETLALHSAVDSLPSSSLLASTDVNAAAFPKTRRVEDLSVEVRVLDEVAPDLDPPLADDLLVKIDVQGFEDRVIRGGRKTIARARAAVIEVQVADLYDGQPSFEELFREMDALGHAFIGVLDQFSDPTGRVLYFDAVFLRA